MSEWKTYKLGNLVEITSSKRIMRSEYLSEGIPFFRSKEIIELNHGNSISTELFISSNRYEEIKRKFGVPQNGDMLLTSVGTLGIPYLVQEKDKFYFKDGNLTWFRDFNEKLSNKFLFYWINSPIGKARINKVSIGSTQKALTISSLKSLDIELPPIYQQLKIVNILDSLSQKIQLNTQTNQTLEAIAQAIFKSWFVDFDPVRAKAQAILDGKTNDEANLSAMSVISGKAIEDLSQTEYQQLWEIADAFPSELVESAEFGEVPKGWEILSVGDVATITKGKSYKSSELEPSSTALVTLKSFNRGGGYRLDGLKEYSGTYKAEQEVFAGDLIVAYTDVTQAADVIGKPAMVMSDSRYEHLVISLDVGVVRPKNEKFKYFLYCLAMTDLFQNHTKSFCTGTTVLHLAKEAVPSFEFIKPNDNLINLFDKLVSSMFIKINEYIEENKNLEKTRDLLLPRLLSGELFNE